MRRLTSYGESDLSFVPLATGALVVAASVLNAVAALLSMEGWGQRTGNGKIGAVSLVVGVTLLLGFNFALYPLLVVSQGVSARTAGLLTDLWIIFMPLGLLLVGVGFNLRRSGIFLKRKRR